MLKVLARDVRAVTALEYGIIAAMIVVVIIGSVQTFAGNIVDLWNMISDAINKAVSS